MRRYDLAFKYAFEYRQNENMYASTVRKLQERQQTGNAMLRKANQARVGILFVYNFPTR
jgi:hypothetical protein